MNGKALQQAVIGLLVLTALAIGVALQLGVEQVSAPQLITVSALCLLPGCAAALRAGHAGTFHGLLTGLLGGLLLALLLWASAPVNTEPLLQVLGERAGVVLVLAAFWSVTGGLVGDIVLLVKRRRAERRARQGGAD